MNAIWVLEGYDSALKSDDPRDINRFLWQHCQDFIDVIRQQRFVIDMLDDIIADKDEGIERLQEILDDQDAYIHALEEETRDVYGD